MLSSRRLGRLSLASLAVLAACSTPPPPPPPAPPPPVVPTIKPMPPSNAVQGMSIPEQAADGKYLTANRGVTSNTALWHLRMGLNVAALNCDKYGPAARLQYNQLLAVHKTALNGANAAVDRNYSVAYGSSGMASRERLNTVVYNFFALPPVIKSFCPVAVTVGAKMIAMPAAQLLESAPALLAELEKPFQDFYAAYADYLRRLAEWQSRFGATVTVVVSPTPLPPPPIPPGEAPPKGWTPSVTTSTAAAATQPVTPAAPTGTAPPSGPPSATRTLPDNSQPKLVVQPLPTTGE
ncbi:hypothetical protein HHL08_02040 [Sphingobium sp. AR-3-1]|uniref:Lipoprotein n=1 Tax=Sphingobium psychrophilum TaxID=2728834 RepID=A0A7X9ZS91_9SPHN|nr:hypothetical protein [Sphingobium psychrophilum]NML08934.1 hypothetical protein [Sphingobium psychrophilum]